MWLILFVFTILLVSLSPATAQPSGQNDWDNIAELNGRENLYGKHHDRGFGKLGIHLDVANSSRRGSNKTYWSYPYENHVHPDRGSQKKMIAEAKKYGFAMAGRFKVGEGSRTEYFWYRDVEIVPYGEKPTAKSTGHIPTDQGEITTVNPASGYVPDNGTFIDPDKALTIPAPRRNFGLDAFGHHSYAGGWTFGYQSELDKDDNRLTSYDQELVDRYLPNTKRGDLGIFKDKKAADANWYWCINPNASDPVTGASYVQEPTRFSPQTGYSDLPQIGYIMRLFNRVAPRTGAEPELPAFYEKMRTFFNDVIIGGNNLDQPFEWDKNLKNRDIKEIFERLATIDGQPHTVQGEVIPVQTDRNEMRMPIDGTAATDDGRRITISGLAIEYTLQTYAQKMPRGAIDKVVGMRAYDLTVNSNRTYEYESQPAIRKMIRLLSAIVVAATEKGTFAKYTDDVFNYQIDTIRKNISPLDSGKSDVTVSIHKDLTDTSVANKSHLEFVLPPNVTIKDTNITARDGVYRVPENQETITFSFPGKTLDVPIRFIQKKDAKISGMVFMDRRMFNKDEVSGHWMVREFVNWNSGGELGQQIASFTEQNQEISISLDIYLDTPASLNTKVTAAGISAKERKPGVEPAPAILTLDKFENTQGKQKPIPVTDTITYEGLKPNATYQLEGKLFKVLHDGSEVKYVDQDNPVVLKTKTFVADGQGYGIETLDFGNISNLEYGSEYVVYERAILQNSDPKYDRQIVHENPYDRVQTFVTPPEPAHIETTVALHVKDDLVSEHWLESSAQSVVEITQDQAAAVRIKDKIEYFGLVDGQKYKVTAKLVKLSDDGTQTVINTTTRGIIAGKNHNTYVDLGLDSHGFTRSQVKNGVYMELDPGRYVIFEEIEHIKGYQLKQIESDKYRYVYVEGEPDNKTVIRPHKDPNDKAQTFIVSRAGVPDLPSLPFTGGTSALLFHICGLLIILSMAGLLSCRRGKEKRGS